VFFTYQHCFERPDRPKRNECTEAVVLTNQPISRLQFQREIIAEKARAMVGVVFALRRIFFPRFVRGIQVRPDLSMRMRIACPHQSASILKNLNPINKGLGAEFLKLRDPHVNHQANLIDAHARDCQVVAR
jgi:hypothetical protein